MPDTSKEWGVNQLRLTGFLGPSAKFDPTGMWESLTGEKPDSVVENPKLATRESIGSILGGSLSAQANSLRIDWIFGPPAGADPPMLHSLGAWSECTPKFVQMMEHWLGSEGSPQFVRLAFAAVLLRPTESREAGYRLLNEYLAFAKIDEMRSSDFLYQINHPQPSKVTSLTVNRLTKWSVLMIQAIVGHAGGLAAMTPSLAVKLELDVNTSADNLEVIPREKVAPLFSELFASADAITKEGERA